MPVQGFSLDKLLAHAAFSVPLHKGVIWCILYHVPFNMVEKTATKRPSRAKPARPGSRSGGKEEAVPSRLRIRVVAYEHAILDKAVKQIIDVAARHNAHVIGPVPLPIDIKKYTVNRASFIDKDSREQFEMRIHKRMIDILNPAPKVIEALTNIDLPSGVSIDVKMM